MSEEQSGDRRARGKPHRADPATEGGELAHAVTLATDGPTDSRRIALLANAAARLTEAGTDPIATSLADTVPPIDKAAGKPRGGPDAVATQPGLTAPDTEERDLARGSLIDRFVVLDQLGFGGMGVVVSAYDPELDRRVAIKVLRNDLFRAEQPTAGRQRLQREARAMARLSHPNVVTVYEIGRFGDRVYVVMEYVDGRTVTRWLDAEPRGWREIVEVFARAGHGLAAAHEAGLVHRDFKPDNVLVGNSGRVQVTDFGLVSTTGQEIDAGATRAELSPSALNTSLTCTGAILGTPVYMAPEQHAGEPADPRTDQFSFCVALHEALYRQRPFAGATYDEIADQVQAGRIREPPAASDVPPWLRQVLLRGMARQPADRYPSMAELLHQLDRDPVTRHRRRLRLAALVTTFVALAGVATFGLLHRSATRSAVCRGAAAELSGAWDPEVAARIDEAFTATGLPYAAGSLAGVTRLLDDYAANWVAMRTEACEATHLRGSQSAELLDLRMMCLDDRRTALQALTRLLGRADGELVEGAVDAVASLPGLAGCADLRALREVVPLPEDPAVRQRIEEVRQQLAEATALSRAGKYQEGLAASKAALAAITDLGYRPIEADALRIHAALLMQSGEPRAAATMLVDAEMAALAGRDNETAIRAATQLVWATGYRLGDGEQGEQWGRIASALLERGTEGSDLEAELHSNLAVLEVVRGNYAVAREHAERALALRRAAYGDDHPITASSYFNLGVALKKLGQLDEALAAYQHTLTVVRASLGEDHPKTAMALHNIGVVEKRMEREDQAEAHLQDALERWQRTLPPNHQNIGMALFNLGIVQIERGKLDEAEANLKHAWEIKQAKFGPDHPSVIMVTQALASVARARGDDREALRLMLPVIPALSAKLGDDHPSVATALFDLGRVQRALGDYSAADHAFARALAIRRAKLPADHPDLRALLINIGQLELERGRADRAIEPLREAADGYQRVATQRADDADAADNLAGTQFLLARALWESGRDRTQARRLAERAAKTLAASPNPVAADQTTEVERWLAAHPR